MHKGQRNIPDIKIGETLNVHLVGSLRGGLQSEERIGGRRGFIIEDKTWKWASVGEVWKVRLEAENAPKQTLYFLRLLTRVSTLDEVTDDKPISGDSLRVMAQKAGAHFHALQFSEAAAIYERGLEQHPEEAFFAVRLAACYVKIGRPLDAISLYQQLASHYLDTVSELTGLRVDELERSPPKKAG